MATSIFARLTDEVKKTQKESEKCGFMARGGVKGVFLSKIHKIFTKVFNLWINEFTQNQK